MRKFSRFLRVALLPLAVLAMVAGTSAVASAATVDLSSTTDTVTAPASTSFQITPFSMNY